jgi:hypothetical protein
MKAGNFHVSVHMHIHDEYNHWQGVKIYAIIIIISITSRLGPNGPFRDNCQLVMFSPLNIRHTTANHFTVLHGQRKLI